jgi:hypothetical protein
MPRSEVIAEYEADCSQVEGARTGEVYHVARTSAGGRRLTPIARYFAFRKAFYECFHEHWRLDCLVRTHRLAPPPAILGEALARSLLREGICTQPLWVSWHRNDELGGMVFGDVFDLD